MCEAPGCPPLGDDETLSGLLLPSLGQIWVNADEAVQWPPRRRFTIAHELGHHVLHRTRPAVAVLPQGGRRPRGQAGDHPPADPGHRAGGQRVRRGAADAGAAGRALLPRDRAATSSSSAWCSSRAARRWAGGCTSSFKSRRARARSPIALNSRAPSTKEIQRQVRDISESAAAYQHLEA